MQIVLSWNELNACRYWAQHRHRQYLKSHRDVSAGGHVIGMPAAAWRALADRMRPEVFHAVTGRHRKTRNQRDGVPASRMALQKIEGTLARTAMHPAFRNEAEEGTHGEVLVAWLDDGTWSLYPVPGSPITFFVPELREHDQIGLITI